MMKNDKFTKIVLFFCIIVLSLVVISIALSAPANNTTKYGYAKFRDATGDKITSDGRGQYFDCNIGGEDRVEINYINSTGALNWVKFYPGRMYVHYPSFPPSTRSVKFNFDVAGAVQQGWQGGTHEAVREILRWYKDASTYTERNTTNPGYLNDGDLHVPIVVNGKSNPEFSPLPYDDFLQFAVEPDASNPDTSLKAITLPKVKAFYDYTPPDYWYTTNEPKKYVIYHIVFDNTGSQGFTITPVAYDKKGKPVAWSVKPNPNVPMKLCVATPSWNGSWVTLATYSSLPFEITFSLVPFPLPGAPPLINETASTTWGEIKEE